MEYSNMTWDEERALYNLTDARLVGCTFEGPADGESALKEARNVEVEDCRFLLRYPMWHVIGFTLENSSMTVTARAAIWYAQNGAIRNTTLGGPKAVRECRDLTLEGVKADSTEFGWKCRRLRMSDCDITSEYFLLDSRDIVMKDTRFKGKYSFQYVENAVIENCVLDTKDAFWHAKNVTVRNCTVKGEYLAWYSENVTFINCRIIGTQPLCYCKGLKLIDCTMEETDLAFELSEVDAILSGKVLSVKNPRSGRIVADGYGEIILDHTVCATECRIETR